MSRLLLLAAALASLAAGLTAWQTPRGPAPVPVDVGADFSATQLQRQAALHAAVRPWQVGGLVLTVAAAALALWLTSRVAAGATPTQARWWAVTLLTTVGVQAVGVWPGWVVHRDLVRVGLDTRSTAAWAGDVIKSVGVTTVVVALAALGLAVCATWSTRTVAIAVPLVSVAAVVAAGYLVPVVIEPLFTKFTPLPAGPLRTALEDMARRADIPVRDMLVADASRRTTMLNAYVSGLGATRRIVVYDTVVRDVPVDETVMIAAHELGHVAHRDVWHNTVQSALWLAAGATALVALAPVAGTQAAAVLLVAAVLGTAGQPLANVVSRAQERRADEFALALATDPGHVRAFAAMQQRLAVANLTSLDPPRWVYLMYATHPLPPERIARARAVARQRGWAVPPPMADTGGP